MLSTEYRDTLNAIVRAANAGTLVVVEFRTELDVPVGVLCDMGTQTPIALIDPFVGGLVPPVIYADAAPSVPDEPEPPFAEPEPPFAAEGAGEAQARLNNQPARRRVVRTRASRVRQALSLGKKTPVEIAERVGVTPAYVYQLRKQMHAANGNGTHRNGKRN